MTEITRTFMPGQWRGIGYAMVAHRKALQEHAWDCDPDFGEPMDPEKLVDICGTVADAEEWVGMSLHELRADD